jgi:poly(A) polymerase
MAGKAFDNFMLLQEQGVLKHILPQVAKAIKQDQSGKALSLITHAFQDTDQRVADEKPVTPAFIFAALLWYPVELRMQTLLIESGLNEVDAFNMAMSDVLDDVQRAVAIPKRFSLSIRDIWSLQYRLAKRGGRRCFKLMEQPKFRGAYDFLQLRGIAEGGNTAQLSFWWQQFVNADAEQRELMANAVGREGGSAPKRKRRPRKPRSSGAQA